MDTANADLLMKAILKGEHPSALPNQLLREFFRGYPLSNLKHLLESGSEPVVKAGVWILSELGARGRVFLKQAENLLNHPNAYVRFFAIDSALTCATPSEPEFVTKIVEHLNDSTRSVRLKAMDFFLRVSESLLKAGQAKLADDPRMVSYSRGIELLLGKGGNFSELSVVLKSCSHLERKFAVIAIGRLGDEGLITLARESDDEEVRTFAERLNE